MAIETINVGTLPNDGTGDPLRTAYIKANNNFASLSNTAFELSTVTTTGNSTQTIFQCPVATFSLGVFQITSSHPGTSNNSQSVTLNAFLTNDTTDIRFTGYGTIVDTAPITTYDVNISSGNVRVQVTPLISANINHFIAAQVLYVGDAP